MNSDRPIRVANIIEESKIGGPHIRMMSVALNIDKNINTTIIIPQKNSEEFQKKLNKLKIKYFLFPLTTLRRNWLAILKYIIFFIFEVIILAKFFKRQKFDIIHISGGCWQYKGLLAAKLAGVKSVWHLNDTFAPILIRKIFSYFSILADSFIYASYRTKKYYEKYVPLNKKYFLIQAPVDIKFYDPSKNFKLDKFFKKKYLNKKIIIGTVANINPVKGLDVFLKAKKHLKSFNDNIIFLIVGSINKNQKNYYKYLLKVIKVNKIKNVYFLKFREDIRPLLKKFDIYVCSSNYEASPLSVWEAMSMGKAIISTDVGDVRKFINNGKNGFIIKPGDKIQLSKKIKDLILNPKIKKNFGRLARKTAKEKLDLKICIKLHLKAYKSILRKC